MGGNKLNEFLKTLFLKLQYRQTLKKFLEIKTAIKTSFLPSFLHSLICTICFWNIIHVSHRRGRSDICLHTTYSLAVAGKREDCCLVWPCQRRNIGTRRSERNNMIKGRGQRLLRCKSTLAVVWTVWGLVGTYHHKEKIPWTACGFVGTYHHKEKISWTLAANDSGLGFGASRSSGHCLTQLSFSDPGSSCNNITTNHTESGGPNSPLQHTRH